MIQSCVHTHSTFCDGKNTMEEMVDHAWRNGLKSFGFSGHSYVRADNFGIHPDAFSDYLHEAGRLKRKYDGKIEVMCGIELDSFSENIDTYKELNYIIASAHALKDNNGRYYIVDGSEKRFENAAKEGFDGSFYALCEAYYKQFSDFVGYIKPQIIGHFDLITKYNEKREYFDSEDSEYLDSAFTALDIVLGTDALIEVNTGAIARGHRTTPYPSVPVLKRVLEKNGKVIITTDAHCTEKMLYWVNEAEELLISIGFTSVCELGASGFYERKL